MAKLGYVRQHFGVISKSALTTYLAISKSFSSLDVKLIDIGQTVELCDIAIFNGVKTYLSNVSHVNSEMIAIICGGPLQINDIEGIVPLDYDKSLSYEFHIHDFNMKAIKTALKSKEKIKVATLSVDNLLLVIDNIATEGWLLTDYNKVTSILNMTSRNNLRAAFVNLIVHNQFDFDEKKIVQVSSTEFSEKLSILRKKIKSSKGQTLIKAIQASIVPNANIKSIVRNSGVEEFELQFFRKMILVQQRMVHPFRPSNVTSTLSTKIKSSVDKPAHLTTFRNHVKEKQM